MISTYHDTYVCECRLHIDMLISILAVKIANKNKVLQTTYIQATYVCVMFNDQLLHILSAHVLA